MTMNNLATKFWLSLLRGAEGEGGGAGGGDGSGAPAGEAGAGDAGAASAPAAAPSAEAPAKTFLGEKATSTEGAVAGAGEGNAGAEGAKGAAFDPAALTLPEGFEMTEELSTGLAGILNNAELSPQDRAQQLINLHANTVKSVVESVTQQLQESNMTLWRQTNDEWRAKIKELPEFKSDPDAEAGKVLQALKTVGASDEFFQALDLTGAGNNPAILQVLHRLAKPFMEGGSVASGDKASSGRQLGANIYTSTKQP